MEYAINYFETIPSWHRSLILIGGIAFFWMLESGWPARLLNYRKHKHAGLNFFFTATTILVNFSLAGLLLWLSDWTQINQWGVLPPLVRYPIMGPGTPWRGFIGFDWRIFRPLVRTQD